MALGGIKLCPRCKNWTKDFYRWKSTYCVSCQKEYQRERYESLGKRHRWTYANGQLKAKLEGLYHYGDSTCYCCGETNPSFLTADHLEENGSEHRRQLGTKGGAEFWLKLKQAGFPDVPGLRVACFNCNMSRPKWGTCPHKWEVEDS